MQQTARRWAATGFILVIGLVLIVAGARGVPGTVLASLLAPGGVLSWQDLVNAGLAGFESGLTGGTNGGG